MTLAEIYQERRRIASANSGGEPLILTAYEKQQQRSDMAHRFAQEANFLYLTGIQEAGWLLVVDAAKSTLVAPDVDEVHRVFDGGLSFDEAKRISGVDDVIARVDYVDLLTTISKTQKTVWALGADPSREYYDFTLNGASDALRESLSGTFDTVKDCRKALARQRAIKTEDEIILLQAVIDETTTAFNAVKEKAGALQYEYEIEAEFTYAFRKSGLSGHAYDPIVAGGKNACTLHYGNNSDKLPENGLVLLDIGASDGIYNADVTRTFAVGEPSKRERAVYDAVLRAHEAILSLIKPGVSLREYQEQSDDIMREALAGLGLLNQASDYRKYFPHAVSHGLGIDVHESLGGFDSFQPGMVLTVEPGIYIPDEKIGVRIEDDILVTEAGSLNMSARASTEL